MGRYKGGSKSGYMGYNFPVTLLITLLITTHEPSSMGFGVVPWVVGTKLA